MPRASISATGQGVWTIVTSKAGWAARSWSERYDAGGDHGGTTMKKVLKFVLGLLLVLVLAFFGAGI